MSIEIVKILALLTLFVCSTFMILHPKVRDGVLLKLFLSIEALITFIYAIKLMEGGVSSALESLVYVSTALVSIAMLTSVVNGTSKLLEGKNEST